MKYILSLLILFCSITSYAQPGSVNVGAVRSRVGINVAGTSVPADTVSARSVTANYANFFYNSITQKWWYNEGGAWYRLNVSASSLLPSQAGNSGKYLTTNGTTASWATVSAGVSTVSSGLTLVGSDAQLGGALTATTTIQSGSNTYNVTNGSQAVSYNGSTGAYSYTSFGGNFLFNTSGAGISNAGGTGLNFTGSGAVLTLGSDADQDIYKRNSSGVLVRIPVGSNGNLLGVTAGSVGWVSAPTSLPPSGSAGGDLTGTYPNPNVAKINGTTLSGLATGILKNTTSTGVPSIAIAADFPTLNQNTSGNAATVTTNANLTGPITSVGNAASIASSVALPGSPTTTTQTAADNSTKIATTAYVDALTTLTSGNFPVGNASNQAVGVPMTGDVTLNNTGVTALAIDRWKVTGTSNLTGASTIAGAFNLSFTNAKTLWNSTYTAAANNDNMFLQSGTFTGRASTSDNFYYSRITPVGVTGSTTQNFVGLYVDAPSVTATGGALAANYTAQFKGTSGDFIINSTGAPSSTRGFTFNAGSSAGPNTFEYTSSQGNILAPVGANSLVFTGGTSATNPTGKFSFTNTFAPTTGSTTSAIAVFSQTINQTGSANGVTSNTFIQTVPTAMVGNHTMLTLNSSSGVTLANTFQAVKIAPTITSVSIYYGITVDDISSKNGFGTPTPLDVLHANGTVRTGGNSTAAGQLKIMEDTDNGTNFTALTIGTQSADITYTLPVAAPTVTGQALVSTTGGVMSWSANASGSFSQVGAATTVFTVTIGTTQANSNYKVSVEPTNVLSAALQYVTNKTTTTFDVTYIAELTGTVAFDWILQP